MQTIIEGIREEHNWHKKFGPLSPNKGELAPDFELSGIHPQNTVKLSQFQAQKPVALIFGSSTCPIFMREAASIRDLFTEYSHSIQFLLIYIREAHPIDGWYIGEHAIHNPRTTEERRKIAFDSGIPLCFGLNPYIDEIKNPVSEAYAAWPNRLYLIDQDGRVEFKSGKGPWGFKPSEMKQAINHLLFGSSASAYHHLPADLGFSNR